MYERFKRKIQPLINIYHRTKAILANIFFGYPSGKLKVVGVTGTDGKTTTTFLIYHILKSAGKKVSMISSIYANVGGKEYDIGLHTTTPDAVLVQSLLKKSLKAGDEYFVLETTSHALDQNRIHGVSIKVGVITNITSEHLDYHKTREKYMRAKAKMLLHSTESVINKDDGSYSFLSQYLADNGKSFHTYSLRGNADYSVDFNKKLNLRDEDFNDYKNEFIDRVKKNKDYNIDIHKKLNVTLADFNNYNYLAAYSAAKLLGITEEEILKALKTFKLPKGRLETVYDKDFKVIIDFAHTENSLRQVLKSIKEETTGRLIHVFGAAGLRDHTKRQKMGDVSGELADLVILTEEDYRTEDPEKICEEIAQGLRKHAFEKVEENKLDKNSKKKYTVIINREDAIKKALEIAAKGDIVVLTGKSHEQSLARGNKEYPYSEEETVRICLAKSTSV